MPKIYVSWPFPSEQLAPLVAAGHEVALQPEERPATREELRAGLAEAEAFVSVLFDAVDRELLDAAPRLRVVANVAVGVDNIDLEACRERGVVVTNTPGVLTDATADLAMALLLAAARRLGEGDALVRSGAWEGWRPNQLLGLELRGSRLGIVGAGRIGRATARRARAFGMEIVYASRSASAALEDELGARRLELDELLRTSDAVSLHVPLTEATHHLIDRARLAAMKPHAILVNTARGPVVDEAALVDALREGRPAAAGLDVFEGEPALAAGLSELPRVVLLPHIGSATRRTRAAMTALAVAGALAALAGRRPEHAVVWPEAAP